MQAGFITDSLKRLKYYKELGDKCLEQLDEASLHFQASSESNSIAVIMQHMHGNMMSRFTNFLTEDGEKPWRQRDAEFEKATMSRSELMLRWHEGWNLVFDMIERLNPEDLLKTIYIRSEPLLVYDAILRQLAHYPYHVGQIIFIAKMIQDKNWKNLSVPKGGSKAFETEVRAVAQNNQGSKN